MRQAARGDAKKQYERIKSLLVYGFWLDRGTEMPSKADISILLDALLLVVAVDATDRERQLGKVYEQFRGRVKRLARRSENADEARTLFEQVWEAVLEYHGF